jgi:hypothetical protein
MTTVSVTARAAASASHAGMWRILSGLVAMIAAHAR